MDFPDTLKRLMEDRDLKQADLCRMTGIPTSLMSNYIKGLKFPSLSNSIALAEALDVSIDDLAGITSRTKNAPSYSDGALKLAKDYDTLDHWGKTLVRDTADHELARMEDESRFLAETREAPEPKVIPLFLSPAAAGIASPIMGEDYEDYTLKPENPQGSMFAVKVQGDSMEPHFPDGSVVFCNKDPLQDGDIGVFAVDGGAVVKQYHKAGGIVYLFSLNRKRQDADVVLPSTSGRGFSCQGRVITRKRYPVPGK